MPKPQRERRLRDNRDQQQAADRQRDGEERQRNGRGERRREALGDFRVHRTRRA
jgi:hypothetical protein